MPPEVPNFLIIPNAISFAVTPIDNLPETFTATNGAQYFIKYIHTLRPKW